LHAGILQVVQHSADPQPVMVRISVSFIPRVVSAGVPMPIPQRKADEVGLQHTGPKQRPGFHGHRGHPQQRRWQMTRPLYGTPQRPQSQAPQGDWQSSPGHRPAAAAARS
jgi:hypothetical protein